MDDNKEYKGKIKNYPQDKTFGFIQKNSHNVQNKDITNDIFFHETGISGNYTPKKDDTVSFNIKKVKDQFQAYNLKLIQANINKHTSKKDNIIIPAPYTFVPVDFTTSNKPAVFHKETDTNSEQFSGAIQFSLKNLTPLLVGQHNFPENELTGNSKSTKTNVLVPMMISINNEKTKRVLIPGSSIKGMLRQSIGAMLNAPMERVGEQYFSYRPNLDLQSGKQFEFREAIIKSGDLERKLIEIQLCKPNRHAVFIRKNIVKNLKEAAIANGTYNNLIKKGTQINNICYSTKKNFKGTTTDNKNRLERTTSQKSWIAETDYHLLSYKGGIDGTGKLAKAFSERNDIYSHVLIPDSKLENETISIPDNIIDHYHRTQKELIDERYGHLSSRHPLSSGFSIKDIKQSLKETSNCVYQKGFLIYIEWDKINNQVVSFGHHFRYRWAYSDTIRQTYHYDSQNLQPRIQTNPLPEETVSKGTQKLTAARHFFGYVSDDGNKTNDTPATNGIGENNFIRMSGRISINNAIEVITNKSLSDRFTLSKRNSIQNDEIRLSVPLKMLGSPKASAVEHYIDQSNVGNRGIAEETVTYGDLPGIQDVTSELNGRKFYRHQKLKEDNSNFENVNSQGSESEQQTIARYISKEGSEFKFSLRFKDLQLWELGAIVVAMQPDLLRQEGLELPDKINKIIKSSKSEYNTPLFAHKLGYGRPLGLGSVHFEHDDLSFLNYKDSSFKLYKSNADETKEKIFSAIIAFMEILTDYQLEDVFCIWLTVINYSIRESAGYPAKAKDNKSAPTIFDYHSDIRRKHSKVRRQIPSSGKINNHGNIVKPTMKSNN